MNIRLPSRKRSPYPVEKIGYLYSYTTAPTLACHDIVRVHQIEDISFFYVRQICVLLEFFLEINLLTCYELLKGRFILRMHA